jgi:O-antigen ligase
MKRIFPEHTTIFFKIYLSLLVLMAIGIPVSKAVTSIVPVVLLVNWFVERNFAKKICLLRQRKGTLLLLSIYAIYLIGLLWTSCIEKGVKDILIQIPLLLLPLVIGSSPRLNYPQIKTLIYTFSASVVFASFCSIWVLLGLSGEQIHDPREISIFISHIRFALMINIAIFSLGWYLLNGEKKKTYEKLLLALTVCWLSIFLVILKSATGWVVFLVVSLVLIIRQIFRMKKVVVKIALSVVLVLLIVGPVVYTLNIVRQFYTIEPIPANLLQQKTSHGNPYSHDLNNKGIENGHYIFLFFNDCEMREAWNKRSRLKFDSTTASGFNKFVIYRYLTSKGFRKDANGIQNLSDQDIINIENGMTNYQFDHSFAFYKRIYQIIWEIDNYMKGGDPSGHSVTQRIEYLKMGIQIVSEDFWFGKGTGGYYPAYEERYNKSKFFHDKIYRQRSHNMFLSYWIDFGIIGMLYICFALIAPVFIEHKTKSFLLKVFLLIVFISFFNEDTLNNHAAIYFFAYLYPLYLYSDHEKFKEDKPVDVQSNE